MIDMDAYPRLVALEVVAQPWRLQDLKRQAAECEERREKARRGELSHHCPSYVHCLKTSVPLHGLMCHLVPIVPVCPVSVLRVLHEMKYGKPGMESLDV